MKVGVALSGGGVKSLSQLPIIRKMMDEKIDISAISGTSMGSVIAALVATGMDIEIIEKKLMNIEQRMEKERTFLKPSHKLLPFSKERLEGGYVDGLLLESMLQDVFDEVGVKHISDVKIPLAIPAVDMVTGRLVVFVSHPKLFKNMNPEWKVEADVDLAFAVRASCSFPIVISAVNYKHYKLVDGGVIMNLPTPLLKGYGADKTVAVTMHSLPKMSETLKFTNTLTRLLDIQRVELDKIHLKDADIVINVPLDKIQIFDIGKGSKTIEAGVDAIENAGPDVFKDIFKVPWYDRFFNK